MTPFSDPFSIRHLPYGLVRFPQDCRPHLCVRFGDLAISIEGFRSQGLLDGLSLTEGHCSGETLNPFLALPKSIHTSLRTKLQDLLQAEHHLEHPRATKTLKPYPEDDPCVQTPVHPGDFVDFYCSRHHAFRVGCLFRGPENALPEQYFHLPIGYHGRSSTIFGSGHSFRRPQGISSDPKASEPSYRPSQRLDYELEVGFLLRPCDHPVTPDQAEELLFGLVLLNDWSARDIQAFEYRPLGPFLGKSFATTVGAWITPLEALQEQRCPNTDSDHPVLPHLRESSFHHFRLPLWATLTADDGSSTDLCQTDLRHLAWSPAQMAAHLSSNGTLIKAGDLIATGTISGPEKGSRACLLERTDNGKDPFPLTHSTRNRTYLEDGDCVTLEGGVPGIGLAPARATVKPALRGLEKISKR